MKENECWEHDFAYLKDGYVIDLVASVPGAIVARPPDWNFPMLAEEYISRMAQSGDGYQFCGTYPYRDGVVIVMKRLRER